MYSTGITPPHEPLVPHTALSQTITPYTFPAESMTAQPPTPAKPFTGAGLAVGVGVGVGVTEEVEVSLDVGVLTTTGVEVSLCVGVGVIEEVEDSLDEEPPAGIGTGFAQTPPEAVDTPFA